MHFDLVSFDDNKPNEKVVTGARAFYRTMTVMAPNDAPTRPLAEALPVLGEDVNVIAIGHSLGAWLATLYTFEIARKGKLNPTMYTFGSPEVGNQEFVTAFNALVRRSYRIINIRDTIATADLGPDYQYVKGKWGIDGYNKVRMGLCQHYLKSYLYLLRNGQGPLDDGCKLGGQETESQNTAESGR